MPQIRVALAQVNPTVGDLVGNAELIVPENSISKPPSAELRPGQLDSDTLPDYALPDYALPDYALPDYALLDDYVEGDRGQADLLAAEFDPEMIDRVVRMVDRAECKRRQYPPGTRITFKAFGRDRRLPISNRWSETGTNLPVFRPV